MPSLLDCLLPQLPPKPAKLRVVKFEGGTQGPSPESYAERVKRQRERDNERARSQYNRVRAGRGLIEWKP